MYSMSDKGIHTLENAEDLKLTPYKDSAGLWTVGYGQRIPAALSTTTITKAQADNYLKSFLAGVDRELNVPGMLPTNLLQHQYDALVCLTYNIGIAAFEHSSLHAAILKHDIFASSYFLLFDKITDPTTHKLVESDGLLSRRKKEAMLFVYGIYF